MARILLLCVIFFHVFSSIAADNNELESSPMARTMLKAGSPSISDPPTSSASRESPEPEDESDKSGIAEAPGIRRLGNHGHSTSAAGGGVIIGGLATVIFAAVFAYIRVTRRKSKESNQNVTP